MVRKRIIMGAAGRDFHNFNVYFRDNSNYTVVAFYRQAQIPYIESRVYPAKAWQGHPDIQMVYLSLASTTG